MVVSARRWRWLAILVLAVLAAPVAAGEDRAALDTPTASLEFSLDRDFELDSFRGTTISWKGYRSPDVAWRIGLSPQYARDGDERADGRWRKTWSLALVVQRLDFMASRSRARPYWGWGGFARARGRDATEVWSDNEYEDHEETWALGLLLTLGAEFVIADRVVLGAEVSLSAARTRVVSREMISAAGELVSSRRRTTTLTEVGFAPAALTVAILF